MKQLSPIVFVLCLCACSSDSETAPTLEIEAAELSVALFAEGELQAVNATPIAATGSGSGRGRRGQSQTLAWIAPNHSVVRKDQVVAKFDSSGFQREASEAEFQLQKLTLGLTDKDRELGEALLDLGNQGELVDIEIQMADRFNIDNELLYSRLQMIDNMRDTEFLGAKSAHLDQLEDHYATKSDAERAVLMSQQQTHQVRLRRSQSGLNAIEVLAPHDGVMVYEKNWSGQEPRVGQQVFPGAKLASLPDLSVMKAILHVPEAEANGLAKDLTVQVRLEAYSDRTLSGTVSNISHKAQPIERDSPIKFFTVEVLLDEADPNWLRPGQRVQAWIEVAKAAETISVPNQSLFQNERGSWVYRLNGAVFEKQSVEVGLRGPNRSQITSGLAIGDRIALIDPELS